MSADNDRRSVLGAVGIGVSDLARSRDFYTRVVGMKELTTFTLPHMDEVVVGFPGRSRSALVLMHWTDGSERSYADLPIKIVCYVPDPAELAARIRADGLEIVREPAPVAALDGAVVGFGKDPDGYLLEILHAPA
ncbi:VOC family protein [Actinomadura sp. 9N407]|uniref:VOC family protein n=1 Tax=Actinomadura sp. 9N407 TaxID=3375154 RepID=UPI0037922420